MVIILLLIFQLLVKKITLHSYIDPTQPKDVITNKIIYLDFETYVRGFNAETNKEHSYETYAGVDLQYFLNTDCYYQPFLLCMSIQRWFCVHFQESCRIKCLVQSSYTYWSCCHCTLWRNFWFSVSVQTFFIIRCAANEKIETSST